MPLSHNQNNILINLIYYFFIGYLIKIFKILRSIKACCYMQTIATREFMEIPKISAKFCCQSFYSRDLYIQYEKLI